MTNEYSGSINANRIDWHSLLPKVKTIRSYLSCAVYPGLGMIKALILQAWCRLSDREREEALK